MSQLPIHRRQHVTPTPRRPSSTAHDMYLGCPPMTHAATAPRKATNEDLNHAACGTCVRRH